MEIYQLKIARKKIRNLRLIANSFAGLGQKKAKKLDQQNRGPLGLKIQRFILQTRVEEFKSNLKKFKKRLDPRLYNGAIFIGLDSPVVKSHGGTDYIGFSNSLDVCNKIIKGNLIDKINENI